MVRRLLLVLPLISACAGTSSQVDLVTDLEILDLGTGTWSDPHEPAGTVVVTNPGPDGFRLSEAAISSDHVALLAPSIPGGFVDLWPWQSVAVTVAVTDVRALWSTRDVEATLTFGGHVLVTGSAGCAGGTGFVPGAHASWDLPVRVRLVCDVDGDGHDVPACAGDDCDDTEPAAHEGAPEICDGLDDDCDGRVDEDATDAASWCPDEDRDLFGDPAGCTVTCDPPSGAVANAGDCDDANAEANPNEAERCNGFDDDCDGTADVNAVDASFWYRDQDGDGFGDPGWRVWACSQPSAWFVHDGEDCDDGEPGTFPGAPEVCGDGAVNDCEGTEAEARATCPLPFLADASEADAILQGDDGDRAGTALAGPGDLDADGFADLAIGAPGHAGAGAAWLLAGPVTGSGDLADVARILTGTTVGDEAGALLAAAGDTDGDGLPDLLVGAPGAAGQGRVYLVSGPAPTLALDAATASLTAPEDGLPAALASAADVDGDGLDDLLVGFPDAAEAGGVVYLVPAPWAGAMTPASACATWTGATPGDRLGAALAPAGDVDGDGLPDFLVGAPGSGGEAGTAGLVSGAATGTGDPGLAAILRGGLPGDEAGAAVAGAGDLDADGFADLWIGAPGAAEAGRDGGTLYLVAGPVTGTVDLAEVAARLAGPAGDRAGTALAPVGDLDGDGGPDLLAGAPYADPAGTDTGRGWLVLFAPTGMDLLESATPARAGAAEGDLLGTALAGPGDLDGDHLDDAVLGAPGAQGDGDGRGTVVVFRGGGAP